MFAVCGVEKILAKTVGVWHRSPVLLEATLEPLDKLKLSVKRTRVTMLYRVLATSSQQFVWRRSESIDKRKLGMAPFRFNP